MTQVVYRGNLAAAKFPLLAQSQGRTIIVQAYDNVYVPVIASKVDEDKDRGIPQIYYCHNVIPVDNGFQSIGFTSRVLHVPATNPPTEFNSIYELRNVDNDKALYAHTDDGKNWVYLGVGNGWTQTTTVGGTTNPFVAYVDGETYIYFPTIGCYRYDFTLGTLIAVVLSGLVAADILGITSAAGYLIAWTKEAVAWSSTVDPTDFVPSLTTGAGGGGVQGAQGPINFCVPITFGFMVFTNSNAVAAVYSGNARYPFNFREITGSGGCSSQDLIALDGNSASIYAYTSAGVQSISSTLAATVFPDVTDFLAGKHFEDFDESTLEFYELALTVVMQKKLTMVGKRYLVLSYGVYSLTHALVYDTVSRKLGKIKINHVDCFNWQLLAPEATETPRECIGFLQQNGTIYTADLSQDNVNANGVLIIGKFQYIRQRMLQLQQADIENVLPTAVAFSLINLPALDGKNYRVEGGYLAYSSGLMRTYNFNEVGINNSLLFIGAFNICSFVLYFNVHGKSSSFVPMGAPA